ncbi:hypothetical protein ACJIZ3_007291 [Penstemon smallii]|uniref:Trichome birefringence-like N-terminal domain-containing protein n=1 Tax=Penstemon smallii TaxID=265156 RepID=A0ABD3SAC7_9LAMI
MGSSSTYYSLEFLTVVAVSVFLITHANNVVKETGKKDKKCDLYDGRWVLDESYPLYSSKQCPLILEQFNCMGNGRPDHDYEKYRWQPNNCNLPRWDVREFGERMRGKRMMFVGDSLSLNQWQSLACMTMMIQSPPRPRAAYNNPTKSGPLSTIFFPQLNFTLMYMRNALIVDIAKEKGGKVLKLDSVATSAKQWLESDILIFDTWHWWLHTGRKQPWDQIQDGNVIRKDMDRLAAYEKALTTLTKWIDQNVDAKKIKIFFQGVSPDHWNSSDCGTPLTQRCAGQPEPLVKPVEATGKNRANVVLEEVLRKTRKPIHLLDINEMSQFRVDGHPSMYGNPRKIGMDCTHWCLPGVPDVWNELLYATFLGL